MYPGGWGWCLTMSYSRSASANWIVSQVGRSRARNGTRVTAVSAARKSASTRSVRGIGRRSAPSPSMIARGEGGRPWVGAQPPEAAASPGGPGSDGLLVLGRLGGLLFALGPLELRDALAEAPRQLGELLRPEQEQDDDQDDHQFLIAETEHWGPLVCAAGGRGRALYLTPGGPRVSIRPTARRMRGSRSGAAAPATAGADAPADARGPATGNTARGPTPPRPW